MNIILVHSSQYKKFDNLVDQLNLIKEYDYKHDYKSYLHPNLLDFNDQKNFKKEDLEDLAKSIKFTNFWGCAPEHSVHHTDGLPPPPCWRGFGISEK